MKKMKTQKGITLVALIITVIVLLILSVVAVGSIQNYGILNHAQNASDQWEDSQAKENIAIDNHVDLIGSKVPNGTDNIMFDLVTAENYGDKIEYSAGGVTDWKVFYKDATHLYIITSGYLDTAKMPSGLKMSTSADGVTWSSTNNFVSTDASAISTEVANKYKLSWLKDNNTSTTWAARATADLLNVDIWTAKLGNKAKGIEAIGSPTVEMWIASWNAKGYTKLKTAYTTTGYHIAKDADETFTFFITLPSTETSDKLYFPGTKYWLASPSNYEEGQKVLMAVRTDSKLACFGMTNTLNIRPVVSIPYSLITKTVDGTLKVAQ